MVGDGGIVSGESGPCGRREWASMGGEGGPCGRGGWEPVVEARDACLCLL